MFKLLNGQSWTDESANLIIDQASVSWIWDRRVLGKTSSISFQVVIFRKSSALIENICLPVQPMSTFFNTYCIEKNAKTDKEAHIARQGKLCQWHHIRYDNSFYGVDVYIASYGKIMRYHYSHPSATLLTKSINTRFLANIVHRKLHM